MMAKIMVEYVAISELREWPENPRRHDVEAIRKSMERFGVRWPIIVNRQTMQIEAGHGRLKALRELGETQAPVIFVEDDNLTAKAFSIADNRTQDLTEWDDEGLADILTDLEAQGVLEDTAFNKDDLNQLLRDLGRLEGETFDVEAAMAAAPEQVANTKPGDIWQLGQHRLMCGDSTKAEDVERLMVGKKADMVFTDPPYGVNYIGKTEEALKMEGDKAGASLFAASIVIIPVKPGAVFYVCCPPGNNFKHFIEAFELRCYQSQTIIWKKNSMVLGHGDYHYQHEPILYGWDRQGTHRFYGDRSQTTVWEIDRPAASREHPTMKPIPLCVRAIRNSSRVGDIVIDSFLGSGTTIIAAEQTGRICYGMEIVPHYCDVAIARWEAYTGGQAILVQEREMAYA